VLCALVAAGCGVGEGDDAGEVNLTVTRDYGTEQLLGKQASISESDTVLRVLDRNADLETRYGGGFVQSIDGLEGGESGGRRSDWFFYVNGIESPVGGADYELSDGERIWWDYRDWSSAMRVPAVVGSWPEPFIHGFQGERYGAEVVCETAEALCAEVRQRLSDEGIDAGVGPDASGAQAIRVLVGPWRQIDSDADAKLLAQEPDRSGVFAAFTGPGPVVLTLLDARAEPAGTIGRGGGLVAAVRPGEGPPTWVVTGTDPSGVESAADALGDALQNRYAVVTEPGTQPVGVPLP
jgi:hypothetical protein